MKERGRERKREGVKERERGGERKRERGRERKRERERKKERGSERKRERERKKERERESIIVCSQKVRACSSRKCGHALSVPHSFSQSREYSLVSQSACEIILHIVLNHGCKIFCPKK